MIKKNSLVLYKNGPALVTENESSGKFPLKFRTAPAKGAKSAVYATVNVRPKDVLLLSEGPVDSLDAIYADEAERSPKEEDMYNLEQDNELACMVKECHELLLSDEETAQSPLEFEELVSIFKGENIPLESFTNYQALKNTVYFKQSLKDAMDGKLIFVPRTMEEIESLVKKADEKGKEAEIREAFIARLKACKLELPSDSKFMVDVEALALGKTDKSRTMHDAGIKETPEKAHKLLLDTGIWDITRNPFPIRWGLSMQSASEGLASPPEEERLTVEGVSYAIDNQWSSDPDDAVAFDGKYLWVHIADPASTVSSDSAIDRSARARGATLYIPEGAARMLCEDCLEDYALGLKEISKALSFRLLLDEEGNIEDCSVFKTIVDVKRLTYQKADELKDSSELKPLFDIARRNLERRKKAGAVEIDMPEVHISVDPESKQVSIIPEERLESADMIKEMMVLAGEGAAKFAFKNAIPFPFVSQEPPTLPSEIPEGLAGQYRLRRCMHKRSVGVTPAVHSALGIGMYSQVTSPLRRYGDLISHQQLRAFIDGRKLIDKDTVMMNVSMGDAGAQAAHKAERKSRMHWTLVYLLQNPEWTGKAVCVDLPANGKPAYFMIPSIGQEAYIAVEGELELNQEIIVRAANINIPEQTLDYIQV